MHYVHKVYSPIFFFFQGSVLIPHDHCSWSTSPKVCIGAVAVSKLIVATAAWNATPSVVPSSVVLPQLRLLLLLSGWPWYCSWLQISSVLRRLGPLGILGKELGRSSLVVLQLTGSLRTTQVCRNAVQMLSSRCKYCSISEVEFKSLREIVDSRESSSHRKTMLPKPMTIISSLTSLS